MFNLGPPASYNEILEAVRLGPSPSHAFEKQLSGESNFVCLR